MHSQKGLILSLLILVIGTNLLSQSKYRGKSRSRDISPCYESKDPVIKGDCFHELGKQYFLLEQYDLSEENYLRALRFYPKEKYQMRAITTEAIGDIQVIKNKLNEAESNYNKAIELFSIDENHEDVVRLYEKLSKIYLDQNESEKAKEALRKALELENSKSDEIRLNTKLDIVEVKENQQNATRYSYDMDSTVSYSNSAPTPRMDIIIEKDATTEDEEEIDDIDLIENYGVAEEYYEATGNTEAAIETKKKSRSIAQENQRQDIVGQKSLELANSYFSTNQTDEAEKELTYTIAIADSTENYDLKLEAYNLSATISEQSKNTDEAISTYKSIISLKDSLYQRKLENVQGSNELLKSQGQAEVFAQQKETIALQKEEIKLQKWLLYLIVTLLIAAVVVLYFVNKNHRIQKRLNNIVELRSLRSQMNPHFVFNALNSINEFIAQSDERMANRYLTSFSKLMRSVMQNVEQDFVPLKQDLEIIKDYLVLEHLRFKDKFDYQLDIDKSIDLDSFIIPPMMLQPYIENAIWHGLRYKEDKGNLTINICEKDDKISIEISDNGIGMDASEKLKTGNQKEHKSTAMKNIKNRINLIENLYNKQISVEVSMLSPGTMVQIVIPKMTEE